MRTSELLLKKLLIIVSTHELISGARLDLARKEVGEAVNKSGVDRKDIFVTTKVIAPPESKDPEETYQMLVKAVEKFGLGKPTGIVSVARVQADSTFFPRFADYVDLFLIHTPTSGPNGRKVLWQALERRKQRLLDRRACRLLIVVQCKRRD